MLEGFSKYFVTSSSDLSKKTITVSQDDRPLYEKTRDLQGDEVVESIVAIDTKQLLFTIHKPLRGWYLQIRSRDLAVQLKPSKESALHLYAVVECQVQGSDNKKQRLLLQPHLPAHAKRASSNRMSLSHVTSLFGNRQNTFSLIAIDEGPDAELMRFEETSGPLSTHTSGNLFLNEAKTRTWSVDPLLFISLGLAYLEFREDEKAFKAAQEDIS